MANFQIKVRNLQNDETLIATLDSHEDAVTYLETRPQFIEVITVLSSTSVKEKGALQSAMRPYDDEERALMAKRSSRMEEFIKQQRTEAEAAMATMDARAREEAEQAGPDRPMRVHWDIEEGYRVDDDFDERPISDDMQSAIQEWVVERNTWVEDRGQYVADATVQIYPNEVPPGKDRILSGGTFTPQHKPPVDGEE